MVRKHWHILCMDRVLQQALPEKPLFIYRKASSYGDKIVKKVLDPPKRPGTFWDLAGFFSCRKCKACSKVSCHIRGLTECTSKANNKTFKITEFITCATTHIVYVLQCPCNLVGRTKRPLKKCIAEHINNIEIGFQYHSVSLHFKKHHNQDPSSLKFWGIDRIYTNWRGSNLVREIFKRESRWIYLMNTLTPSGLNVDPDVNCFISDF